MKKFVKSRVNNLYHKFLKLSNNSIIRLRIQEFEGDFKNKDRIILKRKQLRKFSKETIKMIKLLKRKKKYKTKERTKKNFKEIIRITTLQVR